MDVRQIIFRFLFISSLTKHLPLPGPSGRENSTVRPLMKVLGEFQIPSGMTYLQVLDPN